MTFEVTASGYLLGSLFQTLGTICRFGDPWAPKANFEEPKKELGHASGVILDPSREPFRDILVIKWYKKTSENTGSFVVEFLLHLGGPNPYKTLALSTKSRCRRFRSKVTFS